MLEVSFVDKNSVAEELNIKVGDILLEYNGQKIVDILDYYFLEGQESFTLKVKSKGVEQEYFIEKDYDETLGLSFKDDNLNLKICRNNCIFYFVAQMPRGLRKSLYVKDDDYRQSFLYGNFITLTNVTDEDLERIIRLNLSPLYISVQSMDMDLRQKLLNNKNAGKLREQLQKLTSAGISINAQIVLCRGFNDGDSLFYSLNELYKFYPWVDNVAIVPCGMTKFRDNLTKIEPIDKPYAKDLINKIREFNKNKDNFAVLSDEFYFIAEQEVEDYEYYKDFPQIENGVGLTAKFKQEVLDSLRKTTNFSKVLVISGTGSAEFTSGLVKIVQGSVKGLQAQVLAVENKFFGSSVNCTGLLCGGDVIPAVKNSNIKYDYIVIPCTMLKNDEDVFLDGVTLFKMQKELGKVVVTDGSGESFVYALSSCGE
ncbi:MAG: DUF512 domain-containing protein [Clostridia bacterium]|nr:DUF512 domain-containing protein [Clostridia bacterium]